MVNPITKILIGGTIDAVILIFIGLALFGVKRELKYYYKIIPCYLIAVYLFTELLNLQGLHPFALLVVLILLIRYFVKLEWLFSFMSAIISYMILYFGDVIFTMVYISYLGYSFTILKELMNQNLLQFLKFYLLIRLPVIIILLLIYFLKINLIDLSGETDE